MHASKAKKPEARRRVDVTRERLLRVAIDVFGRRGFDGASTRTLANAAGVNLQAIPYYFGSKQGLYIAAAEHIGERIAGHIGEMRERARHRLQPGPGTRSAISAKEARALLTEIIETMATVLTSSESEPWARFLIREQMEPTEAFHRVYGNVMRPTLMVAGQLVGILLKESPETEHVRLRTLSLLGGVMVFRVAHAAVLAQLGWKEIGQTQQATIRALARELVMALKPAGGSSEK